MEREAKQRDEFNRAGERQHAAATRAMALHQARALNAEWNFALPLADRFNYDPRLGEPRAKAKAEYDQLVEENNLQEWELAGAFDPHGTWIPRILR